MKKHFMLALLLICFISTASAIVKPIIQQVNPDNENRLRDTRVQVSVLNNGTNTANYNITFRLRLPNGTVLYDGGIMRRTGSVKGEEEVERVFTVPKEDVEQFGEYEFIVNESVDGQNDLFDYEIVPKPMVDMNFENLDISLNDETRFQQVTLDIQNVDFSGGTPLFEFIEAGVVEVYNVSRNGSTTFYKRYVLRENNKTEVLQTTFNESDYEPGIYQAFANFTIRGGKEFNYTQKKQENFRVTTEKSSMELALMGVPGFMAVLFFLFSRVFASSDGEKRTKYGVALSQTFMFLSLLSLIAVGFVGVELAGESAIYQHMTGFYSTLMFAGGFISFLFLFLVSVVWYIDSAVQTGATGKRFEGIDNGE